MKIEEIDRFSNINLLLKKTLLKIQATEDGDMTYEDEDDGI